MKYLGFVLALLLLFHTACTIVPPRMHITGERTVLESQVVGSYKEIEEDAWAISSVKTNVQKSESEVASAVGDAQMFQALKIREYHADKIRQYKDEGALGETNDGFIEYRDTEVYESNPDAKKLLMIMLEEENSARLTIFERTLILGGKKSPTSYDVEQFGQKFAEEQLELALENDWVQNKSGNWFQKK